MSTDNDRPTTPPIHAIAEKPPEFPCGQFRAAMDNRWFYCRTADWYYVNEYLSQLEADLAAAQEKVRELTAECEQVTKELTEWMEIAQRRADKLAASESARAEMRKLLAQWLAATAASQQNAAQLGLGSIYKRTQQALNPAAKAE